MNNKNGRIKKKWTPMVQANFVWHWDRGQEAEHRSIIRVNKLEQME